MSTMINKINNLDIYAARSVADEDGRSIKETYAKSATLAPVATTGSYEQLNNKPGNATGNADGFMSSNDKKKLNGISSEANRVEASATPGDGTIKIDGVDTSVYVHPTTAGAKHVPSGGAVNQMLEWASDGTAVWSTDIISTYTIHEPDEPIQTV